MVSFVLHKTLLWFIQDSFNSWARLYINTKNFELIFKLNLQIICGNLSILLYMLYIIEYI